MNLVIRSTWALMLGILFIQIGNSLQGTLLGVRGSLENFNSATMGYIMSAYFIGFLGGSKLAPIMLSGVGHVRVFAALGSAISAAFLLFPIWIDPYFWFFLRLIIGFCLAGVYVVSESWLNDISTNETRGKTLSAYMLMQMAGLTIGQLLLNSSDPGGYNLFILISVLVSISFGPILLVTTTTPKFESSDSMSFKELFRVSPMGVAGIFLIGGVFSATMGMSSVYATQIGFSVKEISLFVMMIFIGGIVGQFPIGWLSDHMDRRKLAILVALIGATACLIVYVLPNTFIVLAFVSFLIGCTTNPLYSILIAHTNDFLRTEQMASASGSLIFVNGVGAMGGPIFVGYLMDIVGPNGYFLFIATLLSAIAGYGIYRSTVRDTVEEISPHVNIFTRTTAVVGQMRTDYVLDEIDEEAHDSYLETYEEQLERAEAEEAEAERSVKDENQAKH